MISADAPLKATWRAGVPAWDLALSQAQLRLAKEVVCEIRDCYLRTGY
jgi:hypothetical protein